VDWERTAAIEKSLNSGLLDSNYDIRVFVLSRMLREGIVPEVPLLVDWLSEETSEQRVNAILESLKTRDDGVIQPILVQTALRSDLTDSNRLVALSILSTSLADDAVLLVGVAAALEDGPVLASVLRELGRRPELAADDLLLQKLESENPVVRAEAIRSLAKRESKTAVDHVGRLLRETDSDVRLAAAKAAGRLGAVDTKNMLVEFAAGTQHTLIAASLDSLRELQDSRAVVAATDALVHRETQAAAIRYLNQFGTPDQIDVVVKAAEGNPASEFQSYAVRTLSAWQQNFVESRERTQTAIAAVHGHSGQPLAWHLSGPLADTAADLLLGELKGTQKNGLHVSDSDGFSIVIAEGAPATLTLEKSVNADSVWMAWTPIRVDNPTNIEILTSATGHLTLWLNGEEIYAQDKSQEFVPDSGRFPTSLESGTSLLIARVEPGINESGRFQLRFRRRSSRAEHDRLIAYALKSSGDVNRGRDIFANAEKSLCVRCHRLGPEGGRVGPDLTGIGSRFSRIHLIESILEPSRTVAPSYSTIVVALKDGKVMSGIRISESNEMLVLGDNQGKLHQIVTPDIEEIATQTVSTMPEGLEKKLTDREFSDLLAFLESEKSVRGK
jgi:putative heme-binding domain-containing protein